MRKYNVRIQKVIEYWTEVEADTADQALDNALEEAESENISGWATIDDYVTDISATDIRETW